MADGGVDAKNWTLGPGWTVGQEFPSGGSENYYYYKKKPQKKEANPSQSKSEGKLKYDVQQREERK